MPPPAKRTKPITLSFEVGDGSGIVTRGYSKLTTREGAGTGAETAAAWDARFNPGAGAGEAAGERLGEGGGAGAGAAWDARFNPTPPAPAAAAAGAADGSGVVTRGYGGFGDSGEGGGGDGLQTWRRLVRDVPLLEILPKDPRFGLGRARAWWMLLATHRVPSHSIDEGSRWTMWLAVSASSSPRHRVPFTTSDEGS